MASIFFRAFSIFIAMFILIQDSYSSMSKSARGKLEELCNKGWNLYNDAQDVLEKSKVNELETMASSLDTMVCKIRDNVGGYTSDKNSQVKDANMLILYLLQISTSIQYKITECGVILTNLQNDGQK